VEVVADTGPLNYLVRIGAIDVPPKLFDRIIIPTLVYEELTRPRAPTAVRGWIARTPIWLRVGPDEGRDWNDAQWHALDEGERAVIALASGIGAELILMDDRAGVALPAD
jgi:predicted nucleic acid-binding protein